MDFEEITEVVPWINVAWDVNQDCASSCSVIFGRENVECDVSCHCCLLCSRIAAALVSATVDAHQVATPRLFKSHMAPRFTRVPLPKPGFEQDPGPKLIVTIREPGGLLKSLFAFLSVGASPSCTFYFHEAAE